MRFGAVPHPIPYQGSKRRLAPTLLSYLPEQIDQLVEPFAGSAALSLAAAQRGAAKRYWLNDAHVPLISLWRTILNDPKTLSAAYRSLWLAQQGRDREFFDEIRTEFNSSGRTEHFLYLLARCVKAAVRYNTRGEFNNTPDNRRLGAHPDDMQLRIDGASLLLQGKTQLTSDDYRAVLQACSSDDVVYLDPPYQGVSHSQNHRYAPRIEHEEFVDSLQDLNRRKIRYLVSYDGRTGTKQFGKPLPPHLQLVHVELCAGRSSQATLLGQDRVTYESLYISPALVECSSLARPGSGIRKNSESICDALNRNF